MTREQAAAKGVLCVTLGRGGASGALHAGALGGHGTGASGTDGLNVPPCAHA